MSARVPPSSLWRHTISHPDVSGYEPGSHVRSQSGYRPETTRASTSAATAPSVVCAALKPSRKSASEKLA